MAIINSGAVAIAADSAVTIGQQKIYNSALKVFSLSKVAPVGIMIYGNAGLQGVPWEPVIKTFREHLGKKRLGTLDEYSKHFFKYIAQHDAFFPAEARTDWLRTMVGSYFLHMRGELENSIRAIVKKTGAITAKRTETEFKKIIDKHHANLARTKRLPGFTPAFEKKLRSNYIKNFRVAKNDIFENLKVSKVYVTKIYDIAGFLCTRDVFSSNTTGVVIAGFGDSEVYPSVLTHQVEGIIDGKLKCRVESTKCMKIVHPAQCAIVPFAQEDMVDTFMQGWNPAIQNFVLTYISQLLNRFPDLLNDSDLSGSAAKKKKLRDRLRSDTAQLFRDFQKQLGGHVQKDHVSPILNMVGVLPKDELAAMAESLVNLTAFKRKITHDIETVGGPIDVAVISKGDGLVWVKRKHYFPGELNQHFSRTIFEISRMTENKMAKKMKKTGNFGSLDSWREHYFPKNVAGEQIEVLSEDTEDLGIALANDTFERHLRKSKGVRPSK